MIHKVLVANRGEIAMRILRTCREMGLQTVAVYSQADSTALHSHLADEAMCIGGPSAKESYLNAFNILSAAQVTGCDAIHPGYGFLSENASFARMCRQCGLIFIGPPADVMEQMGDKLCARRLVQSTGCRVIPGSDDLVETPRQALEEAERLGYPVMLKARAGGGGRGIRKVENAKQMQPAFAAAAMETRAAFGDSHLYLEKCILNARHVEIQLLCDREGEVVCLHDRECSLQRNNQKLMEEAPAPGISPALRQTLCDAAVRIAKASHYRNAGTVEFLVDESGNHWFMELNARIQVEHPVTELITGVDIVAQQLRIAAGMGIDLGPGGGTYGHAIECRINAEAPDKGFLPAAGKVTFLHVPGGIDIRFDAALYTGYALSPYYDSMIGKLIVRGVNREHALTKMRAALTELIVEGVDTNVDFLLRLLDDPNVQSGKLDVGLVSRVMQQSHERA